MKIIIGIIIFCVVFLLIALILMSDGEDRTDPREDEEQEQYLKEK